jgi:hypothetical protein
MADQDRKAGSPHTTDESDCRGRSIDPDLAWLAAAPADRGLRLADPEIAATPTGALAAPLPVFTGGIGVDPALPAREPAAAAGDPGVAGAPAFSTVADPRDPVPPSSPLEADADPAADPALDLIPPIPGDDPAMGTDGFGVETIDLARRGEPDGDLGAAGAGASGPGSADPNWIGANTGGHVIGGKPGGVTHVPPPGNGP